MINLLETIQEFKSKTISLQPRDYDLLANLLEITRSSDKIDNFKPTAMHGDLNINNILLYGKHNIGQELRFRLIDIDKFSRTGDYAYDIGEFLVDLLSKSRQQDKEELTKEYSEIIYKSFSDFALERVDNLFPIRFNLARARSMLKLLAIKSRQGINLIGTNPISTNQAQRIIREEIEPKLSDVGDIISATIKDLPSNS
jgi:5-methylthioribose kinase